VVATAPPTGRVRRTRAAAIRSIVCRRLRIAFSGGSRSEDTGELTFAVVSGSALTLTAHLHVLAKPERVARGCSLPCGAATPGREGASCGLPLPATRGWMLRPGSDDRIRRSPTRERTRVSAGPRARRTQDAARRSYPARIRRNFCAVAVLQSRTEGPDSRRPHLGQVGWQVEHHLTLGAC
jgi:hypothetical protein